MDSGDVNYAVLIRMVGYGLIALVSLVYALREVRAGSPRYGFSLLTGGVFAVQSISLAVGLLSSPAFRDTLNDAVLPPVVMACALVGFFSLWKNGGASG